MGSLLSVKFDAFTTGISLQESTPKVKGKMQEKEGNLKKFQPHSHKMWWNREKRPRNLAKWGEVGCKPHSSAG